MDDQNKVTLLGYYGGDQRHALSAWQSTDVELGVELPQEIRDRIRVLFEATQQGKKRAMPELLKMLAEHDHHSPFEKSTLDFQIKGDIASHIHLIKHRIGVSVNCSSARYKELEQDQWYLPSDWDQKSIDSDDLPYPARVIVEELNIADWRQMLDEYNRIGHQLYHQAVADLTPQLGRARAKESARYFLPYAKQLDFDAMFNFRSFIHFQRLRNSPHAQQEICWIAEEMLRLVKEIPGEPFKESLAAFGY